MLEPSVLQERRARFASQLGPGGVAIFPGGHLVRRVHDTDHIFRQRSEFLYLTGFEHPDAVAVLSQQHFVLFVQPRDRDAETWTGRRPGVEGAIMRYGADRAFPISELRAELPKLIDGAERLYHRFAEDEALDAVLLESLAELRRKSRMGARAPRHISDPHVVLDEMRLHKTPEELELMREAAAITAEAHRAAARLARAGAYEYQLEAELFRVFRARGGAGPAYSSIVAAGENATILHYTENNAPLKAGELVLIDAGAEFGDYAADVTRTYPIGGRFEGAYRDVYAAVLRAQHAALDAIRPACSLRSIHQTAVRSLTESLVELGALKGSVDELIENESFRRYYMHGTGHFLGLDVHDAGEQLIDGKPRELEPGFVFTVEPGLYFRSDEPDCPDALRGIGVRIEDDILITPGGYENLTAAVPKEIDAVEAWMRE